MSGVPDGAAVSVAGNESLGPCLVNVINVSFTPQDTCGSILRVFLGDRVSFVLLVIFRQLLWVPASSLVSLPRAGFTRLTALVVYLGQG